jgi:hypothetical protein
MKGDLPVDPNAIDIIKGVVDELADLHYRGHMRGIACIFVDGDGDVRTLIAFGNGAKMPLLAGTVALQHGVMSVMTRTDKTLED